MSTIGSACAPAFRLTPDALLKASAILWFLVAFAGQWMFALYIAAFYGGAALQGKLDAWNAQLINGFIDGDLAGNIALVGHIVLACVITFCGPLQFIPAIRKRVSGFHRWNGRIFITTAFVISIGAAYMIIARGAGGFNTTAILINAALIMFCAAMTLRLALARRIGAHHRWALRTFLLVSGVWFLRIGYAFLGMLFQGRPPGVSDNLDGPTDVALAYLSFFLPIAVVQIYFMAKDRGGVAGKYAVAGTLVVAAMATGLGVLGMTLGAWAPRLMSIL